MNGHKFDKLGPTCPLCGHPWRPGTRVCRRCAYDADRPQAASAGLLTVFGCGVCGALAGGLAGLAVAVMLAVGPRLAPLATLATMGGGVIGCGVATAVRRRLAPGVRCTYEHLLLALLGAGVVAVFAAFAGVDQIEALTLAWLSGGIVAFALLRRYGYGARPPS
jgi:hypothetical protein